MWEGPHSQAPPKAPRIPFPASRRTLLETRAVGATAEAVATAAMAGTQPLSDNGYKVELLRILLRRTLRSLA
jgi:CO/xanthine dehydrogenase FAD-binding subunit